jgi:hypothetical protein
MIARTPTAFAFLMVFAAATSGCAASEPAAPDELGDDPLGLPITGGKPARAFPEAALVEMPGSVCSGVVVAPRVVLTAGHCVTGASSFAVVAPFANGQRARALHAWTEYVPRGRTVNPRALDVGILVLDRAISLDRYPRLAKVASPAGARAVNVGRKRDGVLSRTTLFVGKEVALHPGSSSGFPLAYVSEEIIEAGDSGGPVYVGRGAARTLVAVNSGGGAGLQILARVDLAYGAIQELIAETGGTSVVPEPTEAACSDLAEAEPNDTPADADHLAAARCGTLASADDVDWYTWSRDGSGGAHEVELDAEGDAELLLWRRSASGWARVASRSPTRITATSAGVHLLAVRSPSGDTQGYRLTRTE